jgi:hypothetical protein
MDMTEINGRVSLMESAPPILRRENTPTILEPLIFSSIRGLKMYSQDKDLIEKTAGRIVDLAGQGKVKAWGVTAKEVLNQALEIPKIIPSGDNKFFVDTNKLGGELRDFVIDQKLGKKWQQGKYDFSSPSSQISRKASEWMGAISQMDGSLWEMGIIIERDGGIQAISLSYPWDGSGRTFYERLTPPSVFVGREKELDMFSQYFFGKTHKELQLESAFSADDLKVWWNQAKLSSKIIKGSWNETQMQIRPLFEDRILSILKSKIPNKEFHEAVQNATNIYGYYVTARKSEFPGATDLTLHIDENNWIGESKPEDVNQNEHIEGSYEYMKKNEPAKEKMWVSGSDTLYNHKEYNDPNQDYAVHIGLVRNKSGKSTVDSTVEIVHHLKLNDQHKGTKYYYINNPEFGDGVTFSEIVGREDVKLLTRKDYQKVLDLFLAARKRGEVDSTTYWVQKKRTGLTTETTEILNNIEKILRDKLENSPPN